MKSLFVTATNTDIGKTYTTLKLIKLLGEANISVGICKPIETGVFDEPVDAALLLEQVKKYNKKFQELNPKDITAYTFTTPSAPFCADTNRVIEIKTIIDKIEELKKLCDFLIIEGAGGGDRVENNYSSFLLCIYSNSSSFLIFNSLTISSTESLNFSIIIIAFFKVACSAPLSIPIL